MNLIRSRYAEADLIEWARIIRHDSGDTAAERFLSAVDAAFDDVVRWPRLGGRLEWMKRHEVRRVIIRGFPNHMILYRLSKRDILIERITHGARLLDDLL